MGAIRTVYDRAAELADKRGLNKTQIALGRLLQKTTTHIIGATKISSVEDAVSALSAAFTY